MRPQHTSSPKAIDVCFGSISACRNLPGRHRTRKGCHRPTPDIQLGARRGHKAIIGMPSKQPRIGSDVSPLETFDDVARNDRLLAVNAREDVLQRLEILTGRYDDLLISALVRRRVLKQPAEAQP
jgi:hypothetical protein